MKYLVGYGGGPSSKRALELACAQAKKDGALVYVVTSMGGGRKEALQDIKAVEEELRLAKELLEKEQVACEAIQLARGLSPGEDLVLFAENNDIDAIFLGIRKRSKTQKILLGSTAQYIILKGPCPVTTTK